jgi:hypothetical protein
MTQRFNTSRLTVAALGVAAGLLAVSCQSEIESTFHEGSVNSQARGEATVGPETNLGKIRIAVEFENLPDRNELPDHGARFLLWARGETGETEQLGEIRVAKNGDGSLVTATEKLRFELLVTIEEDDSPQEPGDSVLLATPEIDYSQG